MIYLQNFCGRANILAFFSFILFVVVAAINNEADYFKNTITQNNKMDIELLGGCDKETSPHFVNKIALDAKITYCAAGDGDIQTIEVSEFQSNGDFIIYTAGYFGDNVQLIFEANGKVVLPLEKINPFPGETWTANKISLPSSANKKVKIILIDKGGSFKEWGGLSLPTSDYQLHHIIDQIQAIFWLILFFIVSIAITNLSYQCIKKITFLDEIIIPSIFILLCCIYYLSFWIYYLSHSVGLLFSYFIISISVFTLFKSIFNRTIFEMHKSSNALRIYLLPILYVVILFSFSMSYGDLSSTQKTAATIFTHELPIDNFLPKIFADQVYHEHLSSPLIGDWLSSDRPPLQTGQFLFFYKLFSGSDIGYQLTSMLLQAYCLVALTLFLNFFIKDNKFLKLIIFSSIAFSSVILVNSMFVWPKLIAGTALLFIIYILFNVKLFKSKITPIILSTTLAMISMLAHTGSIFSLVPIAIVSLFVFKPGMRDIIAAVAVAMLMFGPWLFYQKEIDPPGDRLAKWHLAGQISINDTPLVDAIKNAYSNTSPEDVVSAKQSNFHKLFEGILNTDYAIIFLKIFEWNNLSLSQVEHIKVKLFFNFFYSMGLIFFLGLTSLAILTVVNKEKLFKNFVYIVLSTSIASLFIWCLLMFESGSTVIHQGSYFPWLALIILFSIAIFLTFNKFSILFFGAHLLSSFYIYFMSVTIAQSVSNILILPIFLISLVTFLWLSFKFFGSIDIRKHQ